MASTSSSSSGTPWTRSATTAVAALVVALVLVIGALVTAGLLLPAQPAAPRKPLPAPLPAGAAAVPSNALAGGVLTPSYTTNVIPLTWSGSVFLINFTVGGDPVQAAFDTGSARFIVATTACTGCTGAKYSPNTNAAAGGTAVALVDPRVPGGRTLCTTQVAYVSQTDTVQVYRDTLAFPRRSVRNAALCAGVGSSSVARAIAASDPAPQLTIDDFPVGGITANTGTSSLNVFGMSAVRSATTLADAQAPGGKVYLLPSCQTSPTPAYESALLQAVSGYYASRTPPQPTVWSMTVGDRDGFMLFAPLVMYPAPCTLQVQYTPMVPALTTASSALVATPGRYYVVALQRVDIVSAAGGTSTQLSGMPAQLVVDTGTTECMLPGDGAPSAVATLNGLPAGTTAVFTLAGGAQLVYTSVDVVGGIFTVMDDGVASAFSATQDVGILGALGMRNRYFEFDLTQQRIGVARVTPLAPAPA